MTDTPPCSHLWLKQIIRLLRPYQWIKNLLLYSPLFFSGRILNNSFFITGVGVILFCLASSIGYVLNDWQDRTADAHHFAKKSRPFATGALNGNHGLVIGFSILILIGIILYFVQLPIAFIYYLSAYICLTIAYNFYIKQVVILEIFCVALGFVIRILAGGAISRIQISSWLFLTVFFIAIMISVAKRFNELKELGKETAVLHRQSQAGYSANYLNSMLWACGSITLVVYALYAIEHKTIVIYSLIPATYGIFRFIYLTDLGKGSDPIKTLFSDRQLMLVSLIFLLFLTLAIYLKW